MKKPVCVFDFDGTIADSLSLYLTIVNGLADQYGYKPLDQQRVTELRGKSAKDFITYLGISKFRIPFLIRRVLQEAHAKIDALAPIQDIPVVLTVLHKQGYRLGILTSNSEKNVRKFLFSQKLEMFDFIYSGSSIFGKGALLKKLLKDLQLMADEVVYIGDEVRDIDAAHTLKMRIIAVSWGVNTREILEKHAPDYLISKPAELPHILRVIAP